MEDARASLDLFKRARTEWEPQLLKSWAKKGYNVEGRLQEMRNNNNTSVNYFEDKFWPRHITG